MATEKETPTQQKSKASFFIVVGLSTAFLLAMPVIILIFIGMFLDNIFHLGNTFVVLGIIVGFIGGTANVFKLMKLMQKRKQ